MDAGIAIVSTQHDQTTNKRNPKLRKVTFRDNSSYQGEWYNGKMHGHGLFNYANGDIYEGTFSEGKRHGHATCIYQDGTIFEGYWVRAF